MGVLFSKHRNRIFSVPSLLLLLTCISVGLASTTIRIQHLPSRKLSVLETASTHHTSSSSSSQARNQHHSNHHKSRRYYSGSQIHHLPVILPSVPSLQNTSMARFFSSRSDFFQTRTRDSDLRPPSASI